jgi:hypothetical protein
LRIITKLNQGLKVWHPGLSSRTRIPKQMKSGNGTSIVKFAQKRTNDVQSLGFEDSVSQIEPNIVVNHNQIVAIVRNCIVQEYSGV